MYCPKCGADSLEGQKFCKACGTNLQLVSDALGKGEDTLGKLRVDVDEILKSAVDIGKSFKASRHAKRTWQGFAGSDDPRRDTQSLEEKRRRNLPKPKEYLSYSWQHNLRNGLRSLFGGAGLGVALYYIGQNIVTWGGLRNIPELTEKQV